MDRVVHTLLCGAAPWLEKSSTGYKMPTAAWSLPGALGDSPVQVRVNPSWASGLPGPAEEAQHVPEESWRHFLQWLEVGHCHGHQQPVTLLLSHLGARQRLLAALRSNTSVSTQKSLSKAAVIHTMDQEFPVMNIIAAQPMTTKHLIQHTGEWQPCAFSHKT